MAGEDGDDLRGGLIELLRWYADMGVDAVMDALPHDRFAEATPEAAPEAPLTVPAQVAAVPQEAARKPPLGRSAPALREAAPLPLVLDAAVQSAREAAAGAATLDELRAALDGFEGCGLRRTASRLVFADGNPQARIMLVGEAPGAEEDRSGVPFVGRGGQLLDRMLRSIGLDRNGVYIANVVPWRPPGNRTPTPQEVATCLPFITRQIELADPAIVVLLGAAALQALWPGKEGITRMRGRWLDLTISERTVRAIPMLHPAYLLRQPAQKRWAWRDLQSLAEAMRGLPHSA